MSKDKEQPEVEAPEVQVDEAPPEKVKPLAGITIQLEPDGQVSRAIFGTQQNVASLLGLVEIARFEVQSIASGMPGTTQTRESRLLSNAVTSINNIANVLLGMQGEIKALVTLLEEKVDAEPEQKQ